MGDSKTECSISSQRKDTLNIKVINSLKDALGPDFQGVLELFLNNTPVLLTVLKDASTLKDIEAFSRAAHSLKSTSGWIGAGDLSLLAKTLEDLGRSGTIEGSGEILEKLDPEYQRVVEAIKDFSRR